MGFVRMTNEFRSDVLTDKAFRPWVALRAYDLEPTLYGYSSFNFFSVSDYCITIIVLLLLSRF